MTGTAVPMARSRSGRPFRIKAVEPPDPAIRSIVSPFGPACFRIELPPVSLRSDIAGEELKILTDSPGAEELMVPFRSRDTR